MSYEISPFVFPVIVKQKDCEVELSTGKKYFSRGAVLHEYYRAYRDKYGPDFMAWIAFAYCVGVKDYADRDTYNRTEKLIVEGWAKRDFTLDSVEV